MVVKLSEADEAMLAGEQGPGHALAMRVVTRVAEAMGATQLLDISNAHIDSCLDHGQAGVDFAARLAEDGSSVRVPTTLNVSSLDLIHPELYRGEPATAKRARLLMQYYEDMGCRPTWTCAPYQSQDRPAFGDHIAWAESNAIVFANSVLGARTHRYGDFIDICAAVTGRAPAAGLHLDANRRAQVVIDVSSLPEGLLTLDAFYPVLGHLLGQLAGSNVPAIVGLDGSGSSDGTAGLVGPVSEDRLKAVGSASASSGAVGLFHCVGSTPEAPDLATAARGADEAARLMNQRIVVDVDMVRRTRDLLSTSTSSTLGAVSLGTPHYSITEFERLVGILQGRTVHESVNFYVSTGREILTELSLRGWQETIERAGIQLVTDTCTYITPVMADCVGVTMTDSAKWAYYAPGNIGVEVVFGSTEDCVESAIAGRVLRDETAWSA